MQIRISTSDGVPIYQQIVNQVKYLVAAGRLAAGDQLPPVRKLAEDLVINPNTVARAYRELEAEGAITTRRGAGVFIAEGGSPLAGGEKTRIINERIDMLLAEAAQMGIGLKEVLRRVKKRAGKMNTE